jgi:hypothetical protein
MPEARTTTPAPGRLEAEIAAEIARGDVRVAGPAAFGPPGVRAAAAAQNAPHIAEREHFTLLGPQSGKLTRELAANGATRVELAVSTFIEHVKREGADLAAEIRADGERQARALEAFGARMTAMWDTLAEGAKRALEDIKRGAPAIPPPGDGKPAPGDGKRSSAA